jgi:Ca2+-binding RTX toxin-like protein
MPRLLAIAVTSIGLAFTSVPPAVTASNAVPASSIGSDTESISPGGLAPLLCATVPVSVLVVGTSGTSASELMLGSPAANSMRGRGGADCVLGGAGADTIDGGAGIDVCVGGPGADAFSRCETAIQ